MCIRDRYGKLLGAGIHIFEYRRSFLHAKVAVVDRRWATVGSSNIDPFSLLLAREANIVVDDASFADDLHRSLRQAMQKGAHRLPADSWQRLPWTSRLLRLASYNLVRILVGMTGYGRRR